MLLPSCLSVICNAFVRISLVFRKFLIYTELETLKFSIKTLSSIQSCKMTKKGKKGDKWMEKHPLYTFVLCEPPITLTEGGLGRKRRNCSEFDSNWKYLYLPISTWPQTSTPVSLPCYCLLFQTSLNGFPTQTCSQSPTRLNLCNQLRSI